MTEIEFKKYESIGKDYHWEQIGLSPLKRNVFLVARYGIVLDLTGKGIRKKKVLDLGCGDGVLSYLLAKKGARVSGVDNSKIALAVAKQKCKNLSNVEFFEGSVYSIPFPGNSFDFVVCSDVIEHLEEPEKMLLEIKRVWNKQGKIIISTPIKVTDVPQDKMHYQEFSEGAFVELLGKYFGNVRITKSHSLNWIKQLNRKMLGIPVAAITINLLNVFTGFNPFKATKNRDHCCLQTATIEKER